MSPACVCQTACPAYRCTHISQLHCLITEHVMSCHVMSQSI